MIDKVGKILDDYLKPLNIPVNYMFRPDFTEKKIVVSYHFFNESDNLYGDGAGKEFGGSLQIDIFSRSSTIFDGIDKEIINLMKVNKFRFADGWDGDDSMSSVQYFHKILIFNYSVREVLGNGSKN